MSKFFIERPILANVIAVVIVILGLVAVLKLPVTQYPDIVLPTIQVTTMYLGREAVATTVGISSSRRSTGRTPAYVLH
jgi:HAE1 family hydrophobic/amphiphilic exporter-1